MQNSSNISVNFPAPRGRGEAFSTEKVGKNNIRRNIYCAWVGGSRNPHETYDSLSEESEKLDIIRDEKPRNLSRGELLVSLGRAENLGEAWQIIKKIDDAHEAKENAKIERQKKAKERALRRFWGKKSQPYRNYKLNKHRRALFRFRVYKVAKWLVQAGLPLSGERENRRFWRVLKDACAVIWNGKKSAKVSSRTLARVHKALKSYSQSYSQGFKKFRPFPYLNKQVRFTTTGAGQYVLQKSYSYDMSGFQEAAIRERCSRKNTGWRNRFPNKQKVGSEREGKAANAERFLSLSLSEIVSLIRKFAKTSEKNPWFKKSRCGGLAYVFTQKMLSRGFSPAEIVAKWNFTLESRKFQRTRHFSHFLFNN